MISPPFDVICLIHNFLEMLLLHNKFSFIILFTVLWIVGAFIILVKLFNHPLSLNNSALFSLMNSNLLFSFLTILTVFPIMNLITVLFLLLILKIGVKNAEIFMPQLVQLNLIASIICGLLITENKDDFQLIATIISFALIFQYFFPKNLKDIIINIQNKSINKRKHINKKKNKK